MRFVSEVTRILSEYTEEDPRAVEELLPLVYEELRRLAAAKLANEKPGQTLQATALVHEAWLKLVGTHQRWTTTGSSSIPLPAARAKRKRIWERNFPSARPWY